MTKEELEKEAEEKFESDNGDKGRKHYYDRMWFKAGYLLCAEPREKQIEELKQENKKIFNDWLEACDKYGRVNLEQQKNKEQLERAKRIIEELHEIVANKVEYKSTILMWNTMARAEKLLKEIEK